MDINHPSRIRLTHETLFVLQNWLTVNKEILTQHTFRALAEKATADLGFNISYSSIDRVSKLLNIPAGLPSTQFRKTPKDSHAEIAKLRFDVDTLALVLQSHLRQSNSSSSVLLNKIVEAAQ